MQRALKLAAETIGLASPNPQVGCVLVRATPDGDATKIIGEGAHLYDNRDHAEIVALKQAAARGLSTKGATAYVTLEPCSHHGRTGPAPTPSSPPVSPAASSPLRTPTPGSAARASRNFALPNIEVTLGSPRTTSPRPERSLRPLHPASNSLRHPEGRPLRRRQTRSAGRLALSQPASLAHRPRRPPGGPASPPRQRRRPYRHRHRPRRRSPTHRPQWHLRPQRSTPPPPAPPRRPRHPPPHPPDLATRPLRERHQL